MQIYDEFILFKCVSENLLLLKFGILKEEFIESQGKKTEIFNGFGCVHLTDSALFRQQMEPMRSLLKNQSAI